MTTYSHTITLNDHQRMALEAVLDLVISQARAEIGEGREGAFSAFVPVAEELKYKLLSSAVHMTSTSSPCLPKAP